MLRSMENESGKADRRAARRRDWERRGLVGPVEVLTRSEANRIGRDFREQCARSGVAATRNRHVDLPVLAELCANPNVWQPAHALLGDELLLWRTNMFLGNPRLPWHEDRHARLFVREAFSLSMLLAIEDSPGAGVPSSAPPACRETISNPILPEPSFPGPRDPRVPYRTPSRCGTRC